MTVFTGFTNHSEVNYSIDLVNFGVKSGQKWSIVVSKVSKSDKTGQKYIVRWVNRLHLSG